MSRNSGEICRRIQDGLTTISISRKNHYLLLKLGQKGETFDDVITRLLQTEGYEGVSLKKVTQKKPLMTTLKVDRPLGQSPIVEAKSPHLVKE